MNLYCTKIIIASFVCNLKVKQREAKTAISNKKRMKENQQPNKTVSSRHRFFKRNRDQFSCRNTFSVREEKKELHVNSESNRLSVRDSSLLSSFPYLFNMASIKVTGAFSCQDCA